MYKTIRNILIAAMFAVPFTVSAADSQELGDILYSYFEDAEGYIYVVGPDGGVLVTTINGNPVDVCYDLAYIHKLDIIAVRNLTLRNGVYDMSDYLVCR